MHPLNTMKHWSHHLHDDMLRFEHVLSTQCHNHRFWIGVGIAVLFISLMTLLFVWAWRTPGTIDGFEYMYPYMYYPV